MRQVPDGRNSKHPDVQPGPWRRGWPVLLALFLLVTGGGLGGPGGLAQALRGGPQAGAGAGAADGREPALLRSSGRHVALTQRTSDPAAAPLPIEPGLTPQPSGTPPAVGRTVPSGSRHAAATPGSASRAYQARAPPLAT